MKSDVIQINNPQSLWHFATQEFHAIFKGSPKEPDVYYSDSLKFP